MSVIKSIKQLHKVVVDVAYKEGWQSAYNALELFHGKKVNYNDVKRMYKKYFK